MNLFIFIFFFCFRNVLSVWPFDNYVTIEIDDGKIIGKTDGKVRTFKGIPFAQPPINDLRWRRPIKNKPWGNKYPLKAYDFKKACSQTGVPDGVLDRSSEGILYIYIHPY